jgi:hypothetical protein
MHASNHFEPTFKTGNCLIWARIQPFANSHMVVLGFLYALNLNLLDLASIYKPDHWVVMCTTWYLLIRSLFRKTDIVFGFPGMENPHTRFKTTGFASFWAVTMRTKVEFPFLEYRTLKRANPIKVKAEIHCPYTILILGNKSPNRE